MRFICTRTVQYCVLTILSPSHAYTTPHTSVSKLHTVCFKRSRSFFCVVAFTLCKLSFRHVLCALLWPLLPSASECVASASALQQISVASVGARALFALASHSLVRLSRARFIRVFICRAMAARFILSVCACALRRHYHHDSSSYECTLDNSYLHSWQLIFVCARRY